MAATAPVTEVCINGRFLTQPTTGVQRYAREMVRAIDGQLAAQPELRKRYSFSLLAPPNGEQMVSFEHIPAIQTGRLRGQAWEQLELPARARGRVILNLCNTAPLAEPGLITIHDGSVFAFPQAYSRAFGAWYRTLIPRLGRRARLVLTDSEFSRSELARWAGIPLNKMRIVRLGCEHVLRTPADCAIFDRVPVQPERYILAVGSRSPHKNMDAVVRAVARLGKFRLPLVAAGGTNSKVFNQVVNSSSNGFHAAGYVTDSELRALYENAACFVYPSLYEGFGLPPLEAMACGCPAVVARSASLPEVCGDAALYCDPMDPDDIAAQIRAFTGHPERRAEFRDRGWARVRSFTWDRASVALISALEDTQRS